MIVEVPGATDVAHMALFARELRSIQASEEIQLDFGEVRFTSPAWLAIIGGSLRQLKIDHPKIKRRALNYRHLGYAGHMGFFGYLGLNFGSPLGAALGSETYVPLTERFTAEVRCAAAEKMVPVGEHIHAEAERLAAVLTCTDSGALQDTLAYAIREIIRNVVEHSEAHSYTFAAQYWPSRQEVEMVVSDQGIGLASSLRQNSNLSIESDADALTTAIQPGMSSKAWRKSRHDDDWANSGYGLFMTEGLCRLGGIFQLMSGDVVLDIRGAQKRLHPASWAGTVVVLRLDTSQLRALSETLQDLRDEGRRMERAAKGHAIGPSRASQASKPRGWTPQA
ncbi:ATP-binding protein [Mesorhizobium sp. ISC11]|uniref:ATP-binding protein n=1 Tax=Mesorhizobium sp. ISC11 TaxID=3076428 RepID=UPI00301C0165